MPPPSLRPSMSRQAQGPGPLQPPAPLGALLGPRKVAPAGGAQPGPGEEAGSSPRAALARSLRSAEALLRHCIQPGLRRLLPLSPGRGPEDSEDEDEAEEASPAALARLARLERGFLGLSRSLAGREDPRPESFLGHVRPEPAQPAFSYHATRGGAARLCARLHALLQQHHQLRLAHLYSRRLQAASDFVRRLRAARSSLLLPHHEAGSGRLLRGLCEELRAHAAHWDALQRYMSSDPWLQPLLLQRHASVWHMKRAFSSLGLQALCLLEHYLEALLRRLAWAPHLPAPLLTDFFQGLDIYNQVVKDQPWQRCSAAFWAESGSSSDWPGGPSPFPVERVLGLLAAERGQRAAGELCQLLLGLQAEASGAEAVPWEGGVEAWLLDAAPQAGEGAPSLSAELQALDQAEEEHLLQILGGLVASTGSLWHQLLSRPKQEHPAVGLEASDGPGWSNSTSLPAWKAVRWLDASYSEAARALYTQYRPLVWSATTTSLAHHLERHPPLAQLQARIVAILGQQLGRIPSHACIPQESTEELKDLLLHLLVRGVLQHWDQDFCHVLGSSLTDKCTATPSQTTDVASSHTAQLLHSLFLPLARSLRCLDAWSPGSTADHLLGPAACRSTLLSLSMAASQCSCYWILSKASQYLASSSLSQLLLVTHGDLQLLKAEVSGMAALVGATSSGSGGKRSLLVSRQEQELSQQVNALATSLQHFAEDALRLFSSECKRMSAEIFGQTMPLGKHWRLTLQTDVPSSPSEYASAAAQAVLGEVLQGIQLLPHEAKEPTLGQVTTAFLEAWMDHILAQEIKFSLQGALQLKRDFDLVRELLQSEESGLSLESRQRVLSLRVFQQVDNAIACLLQQPSKASLPCQTWGALRQCCSYNGIHTQASGPGSLNSLESLEGLPARAGAAGDSQAGDLLGHGQGGGCSPETYLSAPQQEWLALRLHGGRRWKMPGLPCMCGVTEP